MCQNLLPGYLRYLFYNKYPGNSCEHPLFPADHTTELLAPQKNPPPKISAEEVYDIPKDSVPRCSSLFIDYSANLPGLFLVAVSPSQGQLQVGCWPHTSSGSMRKKEEVSKSLFVDFTNKFKASNFPTRRPPEGSLRVDLHHLVFNLDSVHSLWWFPIEPSL